MLVSLVRTCILCLLLVFLSLVKTSLYAGLPIIRKKARRDLEESILHPFLITHTPSQYFHLENASEHREQKLRFTAPHAHGAL